MNESIPSGLCQCGCGYKTAIAARSYSSRKQRKGDYVRYLPGHFGKGQAKESLEKAQAVWADAPTPFGYCWCGCGDKTLIARVTNANNGTIKGWPRRYLNGHIHKRGSDYKIEEKGYKSACWIWQRRTTPEGYGVKSVRGYPHLAHRVYYENDKGPIPEGLNIDHLCRNRACVNPNHLEAVTHAENIRRGPQCRLTHADIARIRTLYATGEYRQGELAKNFGVSRSSISRYVTGRSWA